ncbi:MAG TPA: DegQ family serine endoprotease [Myxococcota bacterium]|nr:DegQ family serine endoprotease [Myxococcota bacterium]
MSGYFHSRKPRALIPWSLIVILAAIFACVGFGAGAVPGQGNNLWHERSSEAPQTLPNGFSPLPSLAGLVKQLKPAVVNVYTTQVIKPRFSGRMQRFHDPFFDRFFGGGQQQFEHFLGTPQNEIKRNALGSGFIVSDDGYVITNHHVIADATEIKVRTADERTFDAKLVGSDEKTDVALLKIEPKGKLPFVYLGDSDKLEVGDWLVAIGNPFGLGLTVTAGILSGKERVIGQGPYDDFLQTDASINFGNSGGPLFDTAGNVIGINTAIIAGGSGIGFAVPINLAKELLPQLRKSGKVTRGWLGVGIQDLTEDLADNFGVAAKKGVLISQVFSGSPAEKAGLEAGDIVLSIEGRRISDVRQLTRKIAAMPPGHKAKVVLLRDGKKRSFTISLGEREKGESQALGRQGEPGEAPQQADLGLTLEPLTQRQAQRLGVPENLRGLVVTAVDPNSEAAGLIRRGDIVIEVNRLRVRSINDFKRALSRGKKGKVLIKIQRGGTRVYLVITK